jgi:hypothetical protein
MSPKALTADPEPEVIADAMEALAGRSAINGLQSPLNGHSVGDTARQIV